MRTYPVDGNLNGVMATHGRNMEAAERCRSRHAAIVQTLEQLKEETSGLQP